MIARAFADARIRGSGINLRHSFGSLWGGDELVLQRIMGHAHLSTTRIYRTLRIERLAESTPDIRPSR
jgi:site-specific recombinase XerD